MPTGKSVVTSCDSSPLRGSWVPLHSTPHRNWPPTDGLVGQTFLGRGSVLLPRATSKPHRTAATALPNRLRFLLPSVAAMLIPRAATSRGPRLRSAPTTARAGAEMCVACLNLGVLVDWKGEGRVPASPQRYEVAGLRPATRLAAKRSR
jgi:hypothetical protein